ncbi:MAG: glycosyltransferase family 2 protein [Anaerolineales bacterium]|nr:glycosyltransferase family 2 protein [Anaerolineales bacterium]MCB8962504.1 glycosyltransferase family 2 protein [Ardenticatenales bacterium]MCB0007065.1 glycosyltransferase family 2 protein [Anaerolineales bacterium]MCB0011261.1 glycosyltransferase family 2 protein [Anaerolineales bacterium]MCB0017464.1 glycosyltransferase family 2 protein [Anaerolineales bacterium]
MDKVTISIIAPVYNEEQVLPELYRRIHAVMEGTGESWEMVLVNDGSRDGSARVIAELHEQDPRVKGLSFSRNFGFQEAVTAGLDHVSGDAVVLTDADLQDPPEVIPEMIAKWREGFDVVYGVRSERAGETWIKKATAAGFYRLIRRITNVDIPIDTGDFRLMDRKVVEVITGMREQNRFLRGMIPWVGFRQTGVHYERHARYAGESNFRSLRKMFNFALDGIISFSYLPLRLATYLGFIIAVLSTLSIFLVVIVRLFAPHSPLVGQGTTLVVVLFLGSIQLISLGILGEYLRRIYDQVKGRPLYVVQQTWGIDMPEPYRR